MLAIQNLLYEEGLNSASVELHTTQIDTHLEANQSSKIN